MTSLELCINTMRAITAVEESDGWDSSMIQRPLASNERHYLGRYCLQTSETAKGSKEA